MVGSSRRRWWVLTNVLLVNVLVTGVAWNYVIMFVPEIVDDLGLEIADWGTLWSGIPLGVLLFSIPAGAAGDRFGVRSSLGGGLLLAGGALLLRAGATGTVPMFLSMAAFGVALALVMAIFPKAIAEAFPPEQLGMANGVAQAGIGLGIGAAALLAPLAGEAFDGWRGLTQALGFVSLALALLWWASVRDQAPAETAESTAALGLREITSVLAIREVRIVALCYALYMGGYLGAIGYLPTHLVAANGMSREAAGAMISLGPWSFVVGSLLLPTLSDRLGMRRAVYLAGMLVGGLGLFGAYFATGAALGACIVLLGFGTGVVGLLFVMPVESPEVGASRAGSAIGAATAAGFLGGFLSPLVGMSLIAQNSMIGFGFFASCIIASSVLVLAMRNRPKAN